jgi:hypothetical protein
MAKIKVNPSGLGSFDTGYIEAIAFKDASGNTVVCEPDEEGMIEVEAEIATAFFSIPNRFLLISG